MSPPTHAHAYLYTYSDRLLLRDGVPHASVADSEQTVSCLSIQVTDRCTLPPAHKEGKQEHTGRREKRKKKKKKNEKTAPSHSLNTLTTSIDSAIATATITTSATYSYWFNLDTDSTGAVVDANL